MPTAGHVQVAPDGTGKDIDAQQLTSVESGNPTVLRQTITIGDPTTYGNVGAVDSLGQQSVNPSVLSNLYDQNQQILVELRRIRLGLQILLNDNTQFKDAIPDPGEDIPN